MTDKEFYETLLARVKVSQEAGDLPTVCEAVRVELEYRAQELREPEECISSRPFAADYSTAVRNDISALFSQALESNLPLINACKYARLVLNQFAEAVEAP